MGQYLTTGRKRQRLEHYDQSTTVNKMTELIGRGKISVEAAASLAQCIVIKAFSSLGCEGAHPGNSERDLHRWLNNLWGFRLEPYTIQLMLEAA